MMMMIIHSASSNILSVVTIAFYSSTALLSFALCLRHGFSPNTGFIFLIFFSLIRVSGAALSLAAASPIQNTAALVLSFTGLSPLLLAALGLVYRVRFGMVKIHPTTIRPVHLVLLRVPVMAALVLCDEGAIEYGTSTSAGATGVYDVPTTSRVGVVLFMVVTVVTGAVTAMLFSLRSRFDRADQLVLYAVAASLPFIFARVMYSLIGAYSAEPGFGFFRGSVLLMGCVSILPEMIVVIIYSILGIILPRRVKVPVEETTTKKKVKEQRPKTKIVLVKPWKVVDVESSTPSPSSSSFVSLATTVDVQPFDTDEVDVDNASIQGSFGEDLHVGGEEKFVAPGARAAMAGGRYLGTMHASYLPPLTGIDSPMVFDRLLVI